MIFVTGDAHGSFRKFNEKNFEEQKEMTRDDFVIICGDFGGIWNKQTARWTTSFLTARPAVS